MSLGKIKLRDLSMKALFQYNFYPNPDLDAQTRVFLEQENERASEKEDNYENLMTMEEMDFVENRMKNIYSKVDEIDKLIEEKVEGWSIKRMSRVDLSIIRLAVYEILFDESVPQSLAINEAVNLAKTYGGDESPKFVNGVLSKFAS